MDLVDHPQECTAARQNHSQSSHDHVRDTTQGMFLIVKTVECATKMPNLQSMDILQTL